MSVVRAAVVQTSWTGDKESMIKAHEDYAREAPRHGRQGRSASRSCSTARTSARCRTRSTTTTPSPSRARRPSASRRWPAELGMVMVLPMYEQEQPGFLYNTAAVVDADGSILGKYRKHHIPNVQRLLGEVLLPARQPRLPGVRHRGRQGRRLHLLRPALPRGLARARPERRADRVQPVGHLARPVVLPVEARAAGRRGRQRVLRRRHQPGRRRGPGRRRLLRHVATSSTRRASSSATSATRTSRS